MQGTLGPPSWFTRCTCRIYRDGNTYICVSAQRAYREACIGLVGAGVGGWCRGCQVAVHAYISPPGYGEMPPSGTCPRACIARGVTVARPFYAVLRMHTYIHTYLRTNICMYSMSVLGTCVSNDRELCPLNMHACTSKACAPYDGVSGETRAMHDAARPDGTSSANVGYELQGLNKVSTLPSVAQRGFHMARHGTVPGCMHKLLRTTCLLALTNPRHGFQSASSKEPCPVASVQPLRFQARRTSQWDGCRGFRPLSSRL